MNTQPRLNAYFDHDQMDAIQNCDIKIDLAIHLQILFQVSQLKAVTNICRPNRSKFFPWLWIHNLAILLMSWVNILLAIKSHL